jgi:hypothetical protein
MPEVGQSNRRIRPSPACNPHYKRKSSIAFPVVAEQALGGRGATLEMPAALCGYITSGWMITHALAKNLAAAPH